MIRSLLAFVLLSGCGFIGAGDTVYEWDDASGWSAYTAPAPGAITGMQYMGYGLFVGVGDTVYEWDDGAGTWNSYTDAAPATIGGLQYNGYGLFVTAGTSIYEWSSASGWSETESGLPGETHGFSYTGLGKTVAVGDTLYHLDGDIWTAVNGPAPGAIRGYVSNGYGDFIAAVP